MGKHVDFIVVGAGLAGVVLSYSLRRKGYTVVVADVFKANSATRLAAGVFNPVAYRKLKMAELADILIPEVYRLYPEMAKTLGLDVFHPVSFLKLFTDIEELNNWQVNCADVNNQQFMSKKVFRGNFDGTVKNPFGAGQVLQSGVVKLIELVNAWKNELKKNNSLLNGEFIYRDLQIRENDFEYQNVTAKKIVFCEGIGVVRNPWFSWLPMQQFKGEVLEISAPELKLNRLVNRGVFVLPLENGNYKVGATHDWKNVNENPTEEGENELTEKLSNILDVPYQVVKHEAGLRPATRDRQPYIGEHPDVKNMYVLNGLGSKGVIMAPWLVKMFLVGVETGEWPKGVDILRYIRFYNDNIAI